MDDPDCGSAYAQVFFRADLHNHRLRAADMERRGASTIFCEDCGELIPSQRRKAMEQMGMACTRCVACKSKLERGGR